MFKSFSDKSQNNSKILFLILILLIILFLSWFFYTNNKKDVALSNTNITAVNEASENHYSVEYNSDHTKLILTNKVYKFTLSLPADWKYNLTETPGIVSFYDPVVEDLAKNGVFDLTDGMKLSVSVTPKPIDILFEQFAGKQFDSSYPKDYINQKEVIIDQRPALEFQENTIGYSIGTYILNNNNVYSVVAGIGQKDAEKYKAIYKEIISSLTFSD